MLTLVLVARHGRDVNGYNRSTNMGDRLMRALRILTAAGSVGRFRVLSLACLLPALVALTSGTASGVTIYREIFPADSAGESINLSGWSAHEGPTGTVPALAIQGNLLGAPNPNLAAINSFPSSANNGRTLKRASTSGPFITYTSEYAIDLALNSLTELRFWERNTALNGSDLTNDTFRLAVEIGGTWRVTDQASALTGTTQNTGDGVWSEQLLNLATAPWSSLTFTPGTSLSAPGAVSPLPVTGMITTFGLYRPSVAVGGSDYRLDSVELSAVPVPEPSSVTMLLFGGVVLRLVGRKRRA